MSTNMPTPKEIIKIIESLRGKPFYVNFTTKKYVPDQGVESDEVANLYYIGLVKESEGEVEIYWHDIDVDGNIIRKSQHEYSIEDCIFYFINGTWILKDAYKTGIEFTDVINSVTAFDTESTFNSINESVDKTLIGKKIWFNYPTERKDIESINQFLINNGFRGLTDEYIDELEDFIYDHDMGYFSLKQHDSPLHSEEGRRPYVDYGYTEDSIEEIKENPNWIYYADVLNMMGNAYNTFSNLNSNLTESKKNMKPEVGDYLVCHKELVMEDGEVSNTVGKEYPIIKVEGNNVVKVYIIDDANDEHAFFDYDKWFYLVKMEDKFDTFDIFDKLNESIENTGLIPKVGDYLLCKKDLIMDYGNEEKEATKGLLYEIIKVNGNPSEAIGSVYIINDSKGEHSFDKDPDEGSYYGKWFDLIPKEHKEEIESMNTDDIFKSINESKKSDVDYSFLRNVSIIGLSFYNPEEYQNDGIFYTITNQSGVDIDFNWYEEEDDNYDHSSMPWKDFIEHLITGFFKIKDVNIKGFNDILDTVWD